MSSITSISSGSSASQAYGTGNEKQVQADFKSLATALQSGDLSGAQQAFASLTEDAPNLAKALSSQGASSPLGSLASALKSGDLAGAQKAFASLTQTKHCHHHHNSATASSSSSSASDGSVAPASDGATGGLLNAVA